MENKKEPLMSVNEFFIKVFDDNREASFTAQYANYHTKWHLNNAKEFVADEAKVHQHSRDYKVGTIGKIVRQKIMISEVYKQSIHTAIDNYIEINLNK